MGELIHNVGTNREVVRFRTFERDLQLPLFMPVYQPRDAEFGLLSLSMGLEIDACIVNAFLLYKQRQIRKMAREWSLKDHIGFNGLVATDSGAFQALSRRLFLKNKDIVKFQSAIGSDIISPLDLITPPGDNRSVAERKLELTNKRIAEALVVAENGTVAGVQQGGRFLELRRRSISTLVELEVEYVAIGSLVPFFNRNHQMTFPCTVISDARRQMGDGVPIHIYGAGDPLELPFFSMAGADIFDSSSYVHYARGGWYMTPFGAISIKQSCRFAEFSCECPACILREDRTTIFSDPDSLKSHNLWTILKCIANLRSIGVRTEAHTKLLESLISTHQKWFPESSLRNSWDEYCDKQ